MMEKETITKDDGRLLTYYWFGRDTDCPSSASDASATDHELRIADDSAVSPA